MRKSRTPLGLFSLPVVITVAVVLGVLSASDGRTYDLLSAPTPRPAVQKSKQGFPVVAFGTDQLTLDDTRRSKSKKYDKRKNLYPERTEDVEEITFTDWLNSPDGLPVSASHVIVVGKVVDAQAHLSAKKLSVYSEFKIEIETTFKNESDAPTEDGRFLRAEREGGIVIFPNGFKTWLHVSGQEMPLVGERYLFFLTNDFPQFGRRRGDLFLLTAYRLNDGIVEPLDNPGGGTHAVARYNGKTETALIEDLKTLLKRRSR